MSSFQLKGYFYKNITRWKYLVSIEKVVVVLGKSVKKCVFNHDDFHFWWKVHHKLLHYSDQSRDYQLTLKMYIFELMKHIINYYFFLRIFFHWNISFTLKINIVSTVYIYPMWSKGLSTQNSTLSFWLFSSKV